MKYDTAIAGTLSGRYGDLIFHKNGIIRGYVKSNYPKTQAQKRQTGKVAAIGKLQSPIKSVLKAQFDPIVEEEKKGYWQLSLSKNIKNLDFSNEEVTNLEEFSISGGGYQSPIITNVSVSATKITVDYTANASNDSSITVAYNWTTKKWLEIPQRVTGIIGSIEIEKGESQTDDLICIFAAILGSSSIPSGTTSTIITI